MLQVIILTIGLLNSAQARHFNNPVLDNADYPDPGVIFEDGVYYSVTTTNNNENEKYPMHASTDLQNWTKIGYLFNSSNFPSWSRPNFEFWAPEIHKIGNTFVAYFTTHDVTVNQRSIGVARADKVTGPYIPTDQPLLADPTGKDEVLDATLLRDLDNDRLALSWRGPKGLWIRNLTADGMDFEDDNSVLFLINDLQWELGTIEGPFQVIRNGWYYVFYSGNYFCSDQYATGVARSRNAYGPYEKKADPILVSNEPFKGPGHGSVVQDVDGENWVYVYHAWHAGEVCGAYRVMMASSVEWGDDDWPLTIEI